MFGDVNAGQTDSSITSCIPEEDEEEEEEDEDFWVI